MQVVYLAHDLDDPSCWRRVEMLRRGGAEVQVAGFRRGGGDLPGPATVLGRTANARMGQRVRAIAAAAPRIRARMPVPPGATVLARNLEMLALGAVLGRGRGSVRLVYELLDIHGMMLGGSALHRALRRIEAALMRRARLVVISSAAFETRYLRMHGQPQVATLLIENKPFAAAPHAAPPPAAPKAEAAAGSAARGAAAEGSNPPRFAQGGPLVIGWFGMLRCAWSLRVLDAATRAAPGRLRVVLRGRPALDAVPDFYQVVAANPDIDFAGPYRWPVDLPAIYNAVDLAWLIDRYQAGQNSDWLLPNRLYEGCLNGAAPIVLDGTEVGRRTAAWGCGVAVARPDQGDVAAALAAVSPAGLATLRARVAAIPRDRLEMSDAECRRLTAAICGISRTDAA